jgi:hypothetical protein
MTRARHPRGAQIPALTPIVRRLHLQELQRVRRDVQCLGIENAALSERIDDLTRQRDRAEDCADHWHDNMMQLLVDGSPHGITQDGYVVAIGRSGS